MILPLVLGALLLQGPSGTPLSDQKPPQTEKQKREEKQHEDALKKDVEAGAQVAKQVEKEEKVSQNQEYQARVQRIGAEMAAIANANLVKVSWGDKRLNPYTYHFTVLEGKDVNAFSLPGGFIYVYEGLIKFAQSDDELAGVLAHEVSHAAFRHIDTLTREQSKMTTASLPLIFAAILTGRPDVIGGALMGSQLTTAAFTSNWSVKAEKAADYGGFQYMLKSKYNPTGMLTFMERLALEERRNPAAMQDWGIYKTHPPGKERAEALTQDMIDAKVPFQRSAVSTTFRAQVKPANEGGVEIWFNERKLFTFAGSDALTRADEAASKLNEFFDKVPSMIEVSFDGNSIVGRRETLFTVSRDDAVRANSSVDQVGHQALEAIRGSLYAISLHIWQ